MPSAAFDNHNWVVIAKCNTWHNFDPYLFKYILFIQCCKTEFTNFKNLYCTKFSETGTRYWNLPQTRFSFPPYQHLHHSFFAAVAFGVHIYIDSFESYNEVLNLKWKFILFNSLYAWNSFFFYLFFFQKLQMKAGSYH